MSDRAKPIRKLVTLSIDTARRVQDYRSAEGIPTYSEAMLRLIAAGLGMAEAKAVAPWFTVTEGATIPAIKARVRAGGRDA